MSRRYASTSSSSSDSHSEDLDESENEDQRSEGPNYSEDLFGDFDDFELPPGPESENEDEPFLGTK